MVRAVQLAVLAALLPESTAVQQFEHKRASGQRQGKRGSNTPLGASLSNDDVNTDGFDADKLKTQLASVLKKDKDHKDKDHKDELDGHEMEHVDSASDSPAHRRELAKFHARVTSHAADPKLEACRGLDECKLPMCRWLELTRNDEAGRCPLFEKELMACARWKPRTARKNDDLVKVDCAVDILQRVDVHAKLVQSNIVELEECLHSFDDLFPDTRCDVAFGIVHAAIADYKYRASLQANVTEVRAELRDEIPIARAALSDHAQNEAEVAEALQRIVDHAESMEGTVMVDEIDTANDLLRQLVPIPAARQELQEGIEMSEAAFNHGDLHSVEESIAWMELAVNDAERFDVGEPMTESQQTLQRLRRLRSPMMDLEEADFSANISLAARSNVEESIEKLEQSIAETQKAGLELDGLRPARVLLEKLINIRDVIKDVKRANHMARNTLVDNGDKGRENLRTVSKALNASIDRAYKLGLAANSTVTDAVGNLDRINWVSSARNALHHANNLGQEILTEDNTNISDDREEEIMSYIKPALEWADELHIRNGMGESKRLFHLLDKEESAKETMREALAQANVSLTSDSNIDHAITMLKKSMDREEKVRQSAAARGREASLVAGQSEAKEMVKKLTDRKIARNHLYEAEVGVNKSFESATNLHAAANYLNRSISRALDLGFDQEAAVATEKLDAWKKYLAARKTLLAALKKQAGPRPDMVAELKDKEKSRKLVREGLEPKDLGKVPGGEDDSDDDFDEHVEAMERAIEADRKQGFIDPDRQALLAKAVGIRAAHNALMAAMEAGEEAYNTKSGVLDAIVAMSGALTDVSDFGVRDDVADATDMLNKLKPIEPARTELERAVLEATIAYKTETDLGDSWSRLAGAIARNKELNITDMLESANALLHRVMVKKEAAVNLRAAMIHGDIAMKTKSEEELAMQELESSLAVARRANLTRKLPEAANLLEELLHMHLEEQTLSEAMNPHGSDIEAR